MRGETRLARVATSSARPLVVRYEAARRWRPQLHLNDHGYSAHGWVRGQTGHVPRGFADWLTLITEVPDETVADGAWRACVRSHAHANEAVTLRFLDGLARRS